MPMSPDRQFLKNLKIRSFGSPLTCEKVEFANFFIGPSDPLKYDFIWTETKF